MISAPHCPLEDTPIRCTISSLMEPELYPINETYEHDFVAPSREEKIQAALALLSLGYEIEHGYIAATVSDGNGTYEADSRLIHAELTKWRGDGHDGVAGPYVDMREDGEEPFVPKAGIAYWTKRSEAAIADQVSDEPHHLTN